MIKYNCEIFTQKNTKSDDKPNEDLAIFDRERGIGIILDGVSRDRENGIYPNPSPAQIATRLFADSILKSNIFDSTYGIQKIQKMIYEGNARIRKYNNDLQNRFPAGTVGIVFMIDDNKLHYGYIGDCYASFIREGMMRIFTECQTSMVAKYKKRYSSDEIRFNICNNIGHPCGYGVWDGNDSAMNFVKYGTISLMKDDVLLVYTDGLVEEVESKKIVELEQKPLRDLFDEISKINSDDRTCMRINFECDFDY